MLDQLTDLTKTQLELYAPRKLRYTKNRGVIFPDPKDMTDIGNIQQGINTVFIVDDNSTLRETLVEELLSQGYDCYGANTAEEGLALLKHYTPAAIVCDINLPGIDGLQFAERIEGRSQILFISTTEDYGLISRAQELSQRQVLDKSAPEFRISYLIKAVGEMCDCYDTERPSL